MKDRPRSREAFRLAQELLPGGVNSPVRAFGAVGGDPPVIDRGSGAFIYDLDGNRYADYVCAYGPMISRDGIVFDEFDFTIDTTDALFLQNGLTSFTPANPQTQSGLYTVAFSGRRSSNTDFQEIGEVSMEITVP